MTEPTLASSSKPVYETVHEPTDHEELIMFLERDQFVADASRPVPRIEFSARAKVALWALRVFVIVVSFMVIYTFIHQLN